MPLFEITSEQFRLVETTDLRAERVRERADLQRLLRDQIEVIAPGTFVLAEEFGDWEDSRRRIDLLALDKKANLVVIELKTEEDGGHLELQALRYAAMVSTMTFEQAEEAHVAYLERRGLGGDARSRILEFLGWSEPDEERFAGDVSIVLVAPDFSREITSTVMWLNDRELDIRCVRIQSYKLDGRHLADVQPIIPLPEAEDYQIRLRRKESRERAARRSNPTVQEFLNRFREGRTDAELAVLRKVMEWAEARGLRGFATSMGWGQKYEHQGTTYYFFKFRLDGEVAIWFDYLGKRAPFDSLELREEFRRRLCKVPGVELAQDRIAGRPRFKLAALEPAAAFAVFESAWEWALSQIGTPASPKGPAAS